nr:EcoRII N-terminal effector-binding domain-containing protein [Sphingomonas brevis]
MSANDTGETGAHQAGILVPKDPTILSFFPTLPTDVKNPRIHLYFRDDEGSQWEFAFIYYNNRQFGGTRNEYRLTRMTPFINSNGLHEGDELILEKHDGGVRTVRFKRRHTPVVTDGVLTLGTAWKVVGIEK